MKIPDFFIVGAPKCGTTSMNDYLHSHPDIFMAPKEIHYFGKDLGIIQPDLSQNEYLDFVKNGQDCKLRGEASAWYLYSGNAAKEIYNFNPEAKIIIMLRNPVDMIRSLHRQFVFDLDEDVTEFEEAILLEENRKKGKCLPNSKNFKHLPSYIDSATYAPRIRNYMHVFGKDAIHFILFDEFIHNTEDVFKNTLEFLGIDTSFKLIFSVKNPGRELKSLRLHRTIDRPTDISRKVIRTILPSKKVREHVAAYLYRKNIRYTTTPPIAETLKKSLKELFIKDITETEKLTGFNLHNWLNS